MRKLINMRPVEVSKFTLLQGVQVIGEATFHCFSKAFEEFENGACEFATAIVEYPDGTVGNVPVEYIRFLDRVGA